VKALMADSTFAIFLSKLLPVFALPLGFALVVSSLGILFWAKSSPRLSLGIQAFAIAGLWIAAAPAFADWALASLERQHPPRPIAALPKADVAIVLAGALREAVPPRLMTELRGSSDRVRYAAQLHAAGKVRKILITGGNIPWLPGKTPEAELIRDLLIEWGVPAGSIMVAGKSRNTYENAVEILRLKSSEPFSLALLVTSAAHMPRALAVFRKAGLPVEPATTDVEVVDGGSWTPLRWLPDADALAETTQAMKEWLGLWIYRARGFA
jgi:uncharacterized SAM-binding protein YcdF (DUF218 family)